MSSKIMRFCVLLIVMILSQVCAAQIKGTVFDEKDAMVPFANVVLLNLPDSSYVTGCVTSANGNFTLSENLLKGNKYIVKVTYVGYKTIYRNVTNPTDALNVTLEEDEALMNDVEVKVTRPKTRITADALVTDVDGTILEKAGDVYDMLKHVVGVQVRNEDITVIGAGTPQVYINGRLVRDKNDLHNLMADQVLKVEVVNSPGARYGASVPAVIRITKKKEAGDGLRMDLKGGGSYLDDAHGWSANTSDMFGFRKNGFDLAFRYSLSSWKVTEGTQSQNETFGKNYLSEEAFSSVTMKTQSHTFSTELNYEFDADNSLGIRYDAMVLPNMPSDTYVYSTLSENQLPQEESQTMTNSSTRRSSHYINLYYVGKKKGWDIDFNADAFWNRGTESQSAKTSWRTVADNESAEDINSDSKSNNSLFAAKLIVEHGLWGGSLSFGTELSYSNHYDKYKEYGDNIRPAETELKEDNEAAFLEYKHSFGPLVALAGVRYEHVGSKYYEFGEYQHDQSKQYNNVFPRLNLSLPVKNFNFSLSYRNNIDRPSYSSLSSSMTYVNKYSYSQGNPYLRPSITHKITFNASYKWATLSAGYDNIRDRTALALTQYDPESNIMVLQERNINPINSVSFYIVLNPTIKFWTPYLSLFVNKQWYRQEFCGDYIHLNKPKFSVYFSNTFDLKHNWYIEANYHFITKHDRAAYSFTSCTHDLGCTIRKGFLNDRLQLTLSAENLLGTKYSNTIYGSMSRISCNMLIHQREISFTLRYRFNSAKSKYKGSGAGEDQKNRM